MLALTQIAIPLTSDDATIEWLSSLVAVAFFATSLALAADRWGASRAAVAAADRRAAVGAVMPDLVCSEGAGAGAGEGGLLRG